MPKYIGNYVGFATGTDGTSGDMDGVFDLFDQVRIKITGNWPAARLEATGGTITTPGNGYKYHFLTADPHTFTISATPGSIDVEYVIVGGGGGGGTYSSGNSGGGGGAGGFVTGTFPNMAAGTYPVTIGQGGAGQGSVPVGLPGSSTVFNSITAYGGGSGSPAYGADGNPGASGGGGGGNGPTEGGVGNRIQPDGSVNIPSPLQPQGYPGGLGGPAGNSGRSGGGGGAGGAGGDADAEGNSGSGGVGKVAFSGDAGVPTDYGTTGPTPGRWFAGGGAGGGYTTANTNTGPGGAGGGGTQLSGGSLNGTPNTGGGGGGAQAPTAGDGGSGIVILKYSLT